ncbi:MAG: lamin tail domain-containing protein, partial [Planctomycetes bacterium]|nr:lamin tail domain-containing protein [Planctomycetota bacterium]
RRPADGTNLHTDFKLATGGEYLGLFSPEVPRRVVMEYAPEYPEQRRGFSYGITSAGTAGYFENPTPGAANDEAVVLSGLAVAPRFSAEHGFYTEALELELWTPAPGAEIYYTLNGSEPDPARSSRYTGPIPVAGSPARAAVTVRAAAFRDGLLPSRSVTRTFIFAEHVRAQPARPSGFPLSWGAAPAADYEVDPEIVSDPVYSDRFEAALTAVPTVSIVCDVAHMFGSQGIYSNPTGEGTAWERPCSAELIFPDGTDGFQVNCGVRIQGGASRQPQKSPKHSFRLLFKGDYGPKRLQYRLFDDSRLDSFDTVILRAGFNNSWIHWDGSQRRRSQYIRDQWMRDIQLAMGQVSSHGRFVQLYVNGLYWGLYNLVERPNAAFAADYFGGEKEEYDALNAGVLKDGTSTAWTQFMGMVNTGDYAGIEQNLDLEAFADYMIMNLYGANSDWPDHNWYSARQREPGALWHFFSWDAERILEGVTDNRTAVADANSPGIIFARLRTQPEFRMLFADRAHRHLTSGGPLSPAEAARIWQARANEIETALVGESARWGDYRRDVHSWSGGPYEFYRVDTHWTPERNRLLTQIFPQRSAVALNQFRTLSLYPGLAAPEFNQHGGEIAEGFELEISVPGGTEGLIYYTLDGSDPRVAGTGAVSPAALQYLGPIRLSDFTIARARTYLGGQWSPLAHAAFRVTSSLEGLCISEIMYHPLGGSGYEFIEIHNTAASTLDLGAAEFTNGISFAFPPESPIRPGEHLVLASDAVAFSSRYPDVAIAGVYAGNLDNAGEKVTIKDRSSATVVSVEYDDERYWPIGPDGFGFSLVLELLDLDPDDPAAWRASARIHGSPGEADPPAAAGGVLIHEILPSCAPPLEGAVELFNASGAGVHLGGWYLSDRRDSFIDLMKFRIPDGTEIAPGGFATFYEHQLRSDPDASRRIALDPRGGAIYLTATDRHDIPTGYIASAEYTAADPGISSGSHFTSAGVVFTTLDRPTFGVEDPESVEEFRSGGGAPNAMPREAPVVFNEIMYHPREGEGEEFIELFNNSDEAIVLFDSSLARSWRLSGILDIYESDSFAFGPWAEIPARGFLLVVPIAPDEFRALHSVPAEVPILGPCGGALDNAGERVKLLRPVGGSADDEFEVVDQVRYNDRPPWPTEPDGEGPSLEKVHPAEFSDDPASWASARAAGGTPGRPNSVAPPDGNQPPIARIQIVPPSGTAPLAVLLDAAASSDPDGSIVSQEWFI